MLSAPSARSSILDIFQRGATGLGHTLTGVARRVSDALLIGHFLGRTTPKAATGHAADQNGRTPPSQTSRLIYAIGDVHGRYDLFERMLGRIRNDAALTGQTPLIVLLGDYIDRGPNSRNVLERIINLARESWCEVVALMGNHEWAMMAFLCDAWEGQAWLKHGAAATLASYGVFLPAGRLHEQQIEDVRDRLLAELPLSHLRLLGGLKLRHKVDDYVFVHAGVVPDRPIDAQKARDLLWIREPFLSCAKACDLVVVHGHTPVEKPHNSRWRIAVDTGAYATGLLTAVRLRQAERTLLTVNSR